ncbi:cytochrome C [Geobacter sp.]|uniref:cytochrome C n=1 Tax=Geobacter sp. TaxID=46610 RepID=UPI00261606EA|nr:cytochrome C [Geobacter sp.]
MVRIVLFLSAVLVAVLYAGQSRGAGTKGPMFRDGGNPHNLSITNTGVNFKATNAADPRANQVCIFCHTPHNARAQTPLWNRADTTQTFGHYSSASLSIHKDATARSASDYLSEPNGSSRLCLSCHDGVTALGAILRSGFDTSAIEVNGSDLTVMSGTHVFDRTKVTNSHHPVSFKYTTDVVARLNTLEGPGNSYTLPMDSTSNARGFIKLDRDQRVQCTTCHEPHQSQYKDTINNPPLTPFWVYDGSGLGTVSPNTVHDEVCLACHNFVSPNP